MNFSYYLFLIESTVVREHTLMFVSPFKFTPTSFMAQHRVYSGDCPMRACKECV